MAFRPGEQDGTVSETVGVLFRRQAKKPEDCKPEKFMDAGSEVRNLFPVSQGGRAMKGKAFHNRPQ